MLVSLRRKISQLMHPISLETSITYVAAMFEDTASFRSRAKQVASELTAAQFENLVQYMHHPPQKPQNLSGKFERLGQWMWICQCTIFEIFYNYPDITLPIIRRYAFGRYDWTQNQAIYILCRLAREGHIDREKTLRTCLEIPVG